MHNQSQEYLREILDLTVQINDPGVALFVAMGNVVCEKIASRKNCVGNLYLACFHRLHLHG